MIGDTEAGRREGSYTTLRRIEDVCDRFEDDWCAHRGGGLGPRVEDYFPPDGDGDLLRELLVLEILYRRHAGERPGLDHFLARFPGHAPAAREAFDSAGIRDAEPSTDPGRVDRTVTIRPGEAEDIETRVDPSLANGDEFHILEALARAGFEVTRELGRGGMGIVYEARSTVFGRVVAVKVLRSGLFATPDERRRFLNEARAVSGMDHPGIVPVLDAGRVRGLDYFSMKRIGGEGLDRRLDRGPLPPREAAALVSKAARAVEYAHRRGLLHRDIKPGNILIDEDTQPLLTDFGLARPLLRDLDTDPDATLTGAVLGTPGYMAPEQAGGRIRELTTATDVYGLGGVLYACLTGHAPYRGAKTAEVLRNALIGRPEAPSRLNSAIPADLETICLKCLEPAPDSRYPSARDLADDLDRWLDGRPIVARPVPAARRALLWARRRPVVAALSLALLLTATAGFAGIVWEWREAERQRVQADRLLDYLSNRLIGQASAESNPWAARLTVRELLDRQAARIGGEFQNQPEIEGPLRETVGNAYHSLGLYDQAEAHLKRARQVAEELHGADSRDALRIATRLARIRADRGDPAGAEPVLASLFDRARARLGPDDDVTIEAGARLGAARLALHRYDQAEALLRDAIARRKTALPADHPETLRCVLDLCRWARETAHLPEADALAFEYEHGTRCTLGPNHPDNVPALLNQAEIRRLRGQVDEARAIRRKAAEESRRILGPDHPTTRQAEAALAE